MSFDITRVIMRDVQTEEEVLLPQYYSGYTKDTYSRKRGCGNGFFFGEIFILGEIDSPNFGGNLFRGNFRFENFTGSCCTQYHIWVKGIQNAFAMAVWYRCYKICC